MIKKQKARFPMLGVKSWVQLRDQFKKSLPEVVSRDYLSKTLGMSKGSAANNVFPYLKMINFIDTDAKPTSLATKWIDDNEYANVCKKIIKTIYPEELSKSVRDPINNKPKVKEWFMENKG